MVVGYRKDLNAGQRPAVEYGVKAGSRSTSARCWWSRFRPVLIDNSARVGRAMQIALCAAISTPQDPRPK
jgi:hypothetical protein